MTPFWSLGLVLACAGTPASLSHPPQEVAETTAMDELDTLLSFVARDTLSVVELEQLLAESGSPALRSASVVGLPDGSGPSHVRTDLILPLAELTRRFGEPTRPPLLHPDRPEEAIYSPSPSGSGAYQGVVIVQISGDQGIRLTVRRDPVLD